MVLICPREIPFNWVCIQYDFVSISWVPIITKKIKKKNQNWTLFYRRKSIVATYTTRYHFIFKSCFLPALLPTYLPIIRNS